MLEGVSPQPGGGGLDFHLPAERIATRPFEAGGRRRDEAPMLVSWRWSGEVADARLADLPHLLDAGDVLVVNQSATLAAAVALGDGRILHLSTRLGPERWVVELRQACGHGSQPLGDAEVGPIRLPGGGEVELLAPYPAGHLGRPRLWLAALRLPASPAAYLAQHGRPIRYGADAEDWPLASYQTVFGLTPGSAEMPSAARGFTAELVAELIAAGVVIAPITLHTGVSSLDAGEAPYPEWFRVPAPTAELVNGARAAGHRVVAVGTTATRAIETAADGSGRVHPSEGWTDLVVTPERGVRVIDGILSGWHEPEASHLRLLEAVAGRPLLEHCYARALAGRYRWHEFGDFHLILP
ncbi:MAG: S-adenosylmethionine:tRNA ribosyltransferase-isomerase [Acidimicrobiales bacterium]